MNIPGTNQAYPDFEFDSFHRGKYFYKRALGELRVPSLVAKSRDYKAQKAVSFHTGEHAGHLIGTQFGAPGGIENLGLQNPNMNSYSPTRFQEIFGGKGGSYLLQETRWSNMLEARVRIKVIVEDMYRPGETRFINRNVQWWIMNQGASWEAMPNLDFGNFSSPQGRAADRQS